MSYRFKMQYKWQKKADKIYKLTELNFHYFRKVVDEMFAINLVSKAETLPVSIREYPRN